MSGPTRSPAEEAPEACIVPGCGEVAVRHLSLTEARRAFATLPDKGRRAPLCRAHYRAWKKETREARTLARLGR